MQNSEVKQKLFGIRLTNDCKQDFSYIVLITDLKIQNSDIYPNLRYFRTCKMQTQVTRNFSKQFIGNVAKHFIEEVKCEQMNHTK